MIKDPLRAGRPGIQFLKSGEAQVIVWAPLAEKVIVEISGGEKIKLKQKDYGYWEAVTFHIKPGDQYKIRLNDEAELPDPASLLQPEGVHGPSEAVDVNAFSWTDENWKNIPLQAYLLYELHTGTFTPEGNFAAIESKLDHLKELGITAIELMPVAQFPGNRNWGYDGVFPYAVQNSYGGPKALQHLVNACHEKGLAVVLDVVYNHLGPEGNYLAQFAPFFTDKYKTPWGNAVNFDDAWSDGVRHYFIENALMWFRDFHMDALRFDAVHAIRDFSSVHILKEIRLQVDELVEKTGRPHYLIVEMDLNDTRFIDPVNKCGYGMDAQWLDEFHHALRVAAGGERKGYYEDFNGIEHLAKAFTEAYVFNGQYSPHRKRRFGVKTNNPGCQFVVFTQNHDHIGNRMLGERTSALMSFEMQKVMAAAIFISPYLPMLFMGEEWSEANPFLYFVSHTDPELAKAVREGRKNEFASFHIDGEAPDPNAEETFHHSKLQWDYKEKGLHKIMFRYYQTLIRLRKEQPALRNLNRNHLLAEPDKEQQILKIHRWDGEQQMLCILNFSKKEQFSMLPSNVDKWEKILDSAAPEWAGPNEAPGVISGGKPGASSVTLQPESVLIYANKLYPNSSVL